MKKKWSARILVLVLAVAMLAVIIGAAIPKPAANKETVVAPWAEGHIVDPEPGSWAEKIQLLGRYYYPTIPWYVVDHNYWEEGVTDMVTSGAHVYIRDDIQRVADYKSPYGPIYPIAHEATHVMRKLAREDYARLLCITNYNLNTDSEETRQVLKQLADHVGTTLPEPLTRDNLRETMDIYDQVSLYDELNAMLYGYMAIEDEKTLAELADVFIDYENHAALLAQIHENFRAGNPPLDLAWEDEE